MVALTIVACKNVEQYKAGIEELGTKWDGATGAFGEFSSMVEGENTTFASMGDSLTIDSTVFAKLKPADQTKITDAKNAVVSSGAGYASLMTELSAFGTSWTEKSADMTALKDGLMSGKLDGDVSAKIAELTTFATEGETKLNALKETFKTTKEGVTNSYVNYKNIVGGLIK